MLSHAPTPSLATISLKNLAIATHIDLPAIPHKPEILSECVSFAPLTKLPGHS